jgi:hypothetical protein
MRRLSSGVPAAVIAVAIVWTVLLLGQVCIPECAEGSPCGPSDCGTGSPWFPVPLVLGGLAIALLVTNVIRPPSKREGRG